MLLLFLIGGTPLKTLFFCNWSVAACSVNFQESKNSPVRQIGYYLLYLAYFLLVVGYFVQVLVPLTTRLPHVFVIFRKPRTTPCAKSCIIFCLPAQFFVNSGVFRLSFGPAKGPVGALLALVRCRSPTRGPGSLRKPAGNRFFMIFGIF